jgi:hypothetical protein
MNPVELTREMLRLSDLLSKGVSALAKAGMDLANAEHEYRMGVAVAWSKAPQGTVPEREAWVAGETAGLRKARDLAEGNRVAATEAVRSRRTQLSALQTLVNALKSEQDMFRYGQDVA